jgi:hypothetical protein
LGKHLISDRAVGFIELVNSAYDAAEEMATFVSGSTADRIVQGPDDVVCYSSLAARVAGGRP